MELKLLYILLYYIQRNSLKMNNVIQKYILKRANGAGSELFSDFGIIFYIKKVK